MSFWDSHGYGGIITGDGCFVVRYENGVVVEAWGPYGDSELRMDNARIRIRCGRPNATDRRLHIPDGNLYRAAAGAAGEEGT